MTAETEVSIIIATSLETPRTKVMMRAVESIISQIGCSAVPIIVVNGSRYDTDALSYWKSKNNIRLFQLQEGNHIKARLYGRMQVDTEFFGFLDDDDVYLPGALNARLVPMRADPNIDIVVGNGIIESKGHENIVLSKLELHRADPLISLAVENWMASCSALFRTQEIGAEYFQHSDQYMEWTALAFRLCADGKRLFFLNDLTFRISDSPQSLSKTHAYAVKGQDTLRRLLEIPVSREAFGVWDRKYGSALHDVAEYHRSRGEQGLAWKAHLRSLFHTGGLRYVLYSRHLLLSALKIHQDGT